MSLSRPASVLYVDTKEHKLLKYTLPDPAKGGRFVAGNTPITQAGWADNYKSIHVATEGVIYAIDNEGNLRWHKYLGENKWHPSSNSVVGTGWAGFLHVVAAFNGHIYTVNQAGDLLLYHHLGWRDGTANWSSPSFSKVSHGWNSFIRIVCGGERILYAFKANGDLFHYYHRGTEDFPRNLVGSGWGSYGPVFSCGGGVLFAIKPGKDHSYRLSWYRHLDPKGGKFKWDSHPIPDAHGWFPWKSMVGAELMEMTTKVTPPKPKPASSPKVGGTIAEKAIAYAKKQAGKPYVWGAKGPSAFDCSGLVYCAFKQTGVKWARTTAHQIFKSEGPKHGIILPYSQRQPGDLVFWRKSPKGKITHVAICLGGEVIFDAGSKKTGVKERGTWSNGRLNQVVRITH